MKNSVIMMDFAGEKVEENHQRILEGEMTAQPYRKGQYTGCDYCGTGMSADLM